MDMDAFFQRLSRRNIPKQRNYLQKDVGDGQVTAKTLAELTESVVASMKNDTLVHLPL